MDFHFELNGESFVWDAAKAEQNRRKHGVRFEEAAAVFFDPLFVLAEASRNEEARYAAIGFDAVGRFDQADHPAEAVELLRSCGEALPRRIEQEQFL